MLPSGWRPRPFVVASVLLHGAVAGVLLLWPGWWAALLLTLLANHAVIGLLVIWPQNQLLGPALVRLPATAVARREVALTFDDGPDPAVTPQVLAMLAAAGATASFFCIGVRAQRHPALVRAIVLAGHSVENHTLHHRFGFAVGMPRALRREIGGAQTVLTALSGQAPRFFRAPLGFRGPPLDPVLAQAGLRAASWTRRGYDTAWRKPQRVLFMLLRGLKAGDVLLLHDGNAARTTNGTPMVLAVLPAVLDALQARGLNAVALPAACAPATSAAAPACPAPAAYAST